MHDKVKFSTNSRPKGNITTTKSTNTNYEYQRKHKKDTNNTVNIGLKMTPVCKEQLREIKKATEINTFNCTLKRGE